MLGKVLVGLLVAAGLFLMYSLLFSGDVSASTSSGTSSGSRPLDRSGTFEGVHGTSKYTLFDSSKNRVYTDKGTFFSKSTPNVELKENPGFSYKTNLSGLFGRK